MAYNEKIISSKPLNFCNKCGDPSCNGNCEDECSCNKKRRNSDEGLVNLVLNFNSQNGSNNPFNLTNPPVVTDPSEKVMIEKIFQNGYYPMSDNTNSNSNSNSNSNTNPVIIRDTPAPNGSNATQSKPVAKPAPIVKERFYNEFA